MTAVPHRFLSADAIPAYLPARLLTRQLAAAGLSVQYSARHDECHLTILGVSSGTSSLALTASGHARWLHEPAQGQVGRSLQDRGLAVTLRVSKDWDSFEATTDIDITNPARPQLGTITLSDDAVLDWRCDWRTAFHNNPAALIDLITPILRASTPHDARPPAESREGRPSL